MTAAETQKRIEGGLQCLHDLREHWKRIAQPLTVLIVDDNHEFCNLLKHQVEAILYRRCNVIQAFSGKAALDILVVNTIDILFLDLRMPAEHGNGVDVLKALPERLQSMIVLLVTGVPDESPEIIQASALGFNLVIRKTDLLDDLRAIFGVACSECDTMALA